jgi:hypothetical protein
VIGFHSKHTKRLLPPYYDVAQVFGSIRNQLVEEMGHFKFIRCSCRTWSGCRIAEFESLDFAQNTPNDSSHHIMMLPKFLARSEIDSSKKLEISSSYEVRIVNGVVVGLHISSDRISLKTHQMPPPTIL